MVDMGDAGESLRLYAARGIASILCQENIRDSEWLDDRGFLTCIAMPLPPLSAIPPWVASLDDYEALAEERQRLVVTTFVVELMGLFVEIVGSAEGIRHRQGLRSGLLQVTDGRAGRASRNRAG